MEVSADISLLQGDAAERDRAKARLYVLCQVVGWGAWMAFETSGSIVFPDPETKRTLGETFSIIVVIVGTGLILTHLLRPLLTRWRWKQLSWRALLPRLVVTSFATSAAWSLFTIGWVHGILNSPWPTKYSHLLLALFDICYGCIIFFGWLCLYFLYHTFDRLNRSEIERFQLMTSVKEAELRALKSQVNPHFIFNSLNSLRALIDENPERARQSVTQLANLLRYSLQSGQLETVPFEDELGVVNDYLALEQVRHEERLRLRLDVAPEALRLPIPPMLLQTLVENAVKYGISPRPEGGEIAIVARNEGGALRIRVSNPGQIDGGSGTPSTGVGLHNAAERLRLIFGERATLRIRSEAPSVVVAEAVIPLPLRS
jgi:signal transduction histidine kinase